jgi:site-specific recombinase XerD
MFFMLRMLAGRTQLIKRYMELAHLPTLKKKRGMHSLRHTMASMLLEQDTPLSTISDILGHIDTDSTAVYLKVSMKKLKECSLSFGEEINHG